MSTNSHAETIVIAGLGMVSSIGPDVANSCAAFRAGITRSSPLTVLNFAGDQLWGKKPVVGHAVTMAQGFTGLGKLVMLGALALQDLMRQSDALRLQPDRIGLYVNLSDRYFEDAYALELRNGKIPSAAWRDQTSDLIPRLTEFCKLDIALPNRVLFYGGHAGTAQMVIQACQQIRSGALDLCIVGGIDSCLEAEFLVAAARLGVLKTEANNAGFIPGEAAAFLLLAKSGSVGLGNSQPMATIHGTTVAEEKCDRLSGPSSQGIALFEALRESLLTLIEEEYKTVCFIGDLNGDASRATEWGYALVKMTRHFGSNGAPLWTPVQSFGEVGAAIGAVSCCLATQALKRDYLNADNVLVWLSSENGAKGALRLRRYRHHAN